MLATMGLDRGLLYDRAVGWNADFGRRVEGFLDFPSIDLSNFSAVAEARSDLRQALSRRRHNHFLSSASSFVIQIFPSLSIPSTSLRHLYDLPHESTRIILIFFANMFQSTYFRTKNLVCAFCQEDLSSTHLFDCQGVTPNPIRNWYLFLADFQNEDFHSALDRIFLILQRWTILSNRFQPSISGHIDEYFTTTEFRNRGRDSNWALFRPVRM